MVPSDSGIVVLRDELASIIQQLVTSSVCMDKILTPLSLEKKGTCPICANASGMIGVVSGNRKRNSLSTRNFWEESWVLPKGQEMKCANGF